MAIIIGKEFTVSYLIQTESGAIRRNTGIIFARYNGCKTVCSNEFTIYGFQGSTVAELRQWIRSKEKFMVHGCKPYTSVEF